MLGFFKKRPPEDGILTNLKTVSRWLQDLPAGDIYSAQEKVVQSLIQFNQSDKGFTRDRLQVLMHLDEATRDMQASLCLQYLRNARMSKAIESRLWSTIHAFHWETTRGYHGFLMDFVANPGGSKIQNHIPTITARAIRGFADIIKWRYFRYEKTEEKLWLRLHNLYRIAEFDNFANTQVRVYRSDELEHSPAEEYGQALLLSPFGNGNLLPREIEMIDTWLDAWSGDIRIETLFDPARHLFYVDAGKGYGIKRSRNQTSEPALRFISTMPLLARIAQVRNALKNGASPVSQGLTEDFRLPEGYTLLKQVELEWSPLEQRDRRGSPRTTASGQWRVIHGLQSICGELGRTGHGNVQKQLSPEEILDIKLYGFVTERTKERKHEMERTSTAGSRHELWEQHDSSAGGLGFKVGQMDSTWIKVGKLVAVSQDGESDWHVGVISRLARLGDSNRLVGIRLLAEQTIAVSLRQEADETALSYVVDEPDLEAAEDKQGLAILLRDETSREQLIVDSSRYSRERKYLLQRPGAPALTIRFRDVDETGDAWLRVGFSAVAA